VTKCDREAVSFTPKLRDIIYGGAHYTAQPLLPASPVKNWRILLGEVLLPICPC